ncbi:MoxR family ATPase [Embleya hyalina]|uniref:ATPase AAA n=1 Tax=Embleya hyalina TaxID=516124 RepID=A0A401Z2E5_9ACTN|nr:MoxR family ATPase [Embleya hyalina]GCE01030.1 ATPase AAA [Embleya hyalina]
MTTTPPSAQEATPPDDEWTLFHGDGRPRPRTSMPAAPPWRRFAGRRAGSDTATADPTPGDGESGKNGFGRSYIIGPEEIDVVNAALHLRRPLLVTGHPGTGKSSLARAIAHELVLGPVLHWPVNSRSSLQEALYRYDAIGRLQQRTISGPAESDNRDIGTYIRLGPVGTALVPSTRPRVLLIDELDKGDIDLPNDLLTVLEEGAFDITELSRLPDLVDPVKVLTADPHQHVEVPRGQVHCTEFPIVVITSNGERDFPPAFRRRCIPLYLPEPGGERLRDIIEAHLGSEAADEAHDIVTAFLNRRNSGELATDQLLNAVFLRRGGTTLDPEKLLRVVLHRLSGVV